MKAENFAIETRIMKVNNDETKLDGRFIQGFKNHTVTQELVLEVLDNSTFEISTINGVTTLVQCILPNGFSIIETSTCMSKENYDEGIGAEVCIRKIEGEVWKLLGFLYMTGLNGFRTKEEVELEIAEDKIDEALSLAFDEILEEETKLDIDYLVDSKIYQKEKSKMIASIGADLKANLLEISQGEDLTLDDLVELIIGLYMASKECY